jgi:type IV pilus assembly protein PilV
MSVNMRKKLNRFPKMRNVRGFTLLEVLVALVVLSIGLLGLSGLQTTSLRNNQSALLRSQAVILAEDILDRMRANREEALDEGYDVIASNSAADWGATCDPCTPGAVANVDRHLWLTYVERLPGGDATLDVANGVATITITWVDDRSGVAAPLFETVTTL